MPWSWNPFPNKKVMMKKVFLYRFSREPVLVCDMRNKEFFCSKLVSYNAVEFFQLSLFGMRYQTNIITTTSEVFVYNFFHYTVWNLTKCYCVTSLDLFRISPWKNKQLNIHFQSNTFCVIKSPLKKIKYESHYYFQHIIIISELQKMGRLKCHTVTFRDFHLSCTLIWLFGTHSPLKSHSEHQY